MRYSMTEARTRFGELLRKVERGETVVITWHGRTVAHMVSDKEAECEDHAQAVARFYRRLQALEPTGMTIEEILQTLHEGHRY
ncbi:MAG: type II toxin-antitoxin system prevent-host-death family antitoxin [Gammaproteobacteria bacterium]|nr:type II toxin-antitoxin system prevent-host-death family antitoxin [Gammaproteobacteria bacterium]MDE0302999.1 type II toxin-antitoxin system prevent-host-death family antitoxin [Gammaproteobacteria bacterium]